MQKMIRSLDTARGAVVLRESNLADAAQFRDLRLSGLQDSPTAFSADYQVNFDHPMSFWEGRLSFDEHGIIFFAEHENSLIGMSGIRQGETPKTKHGAYVWGVYIRPEWRGVASCRGAHQPVRRLGRSTRRCDSQTGRDGK